ncbi:MAG TPA: HEPN domain-containing protein [Ardenticatenaceae bacterium]|nr:HEPN domain-containing protein [Ardenticatenaceae bacterium]
MDSATKRAIIRVRLEKAHEDFETARDLLTVTRWRGAVNRAYYAVFHSASAALLWLDIERARHSGVEAAFHQFFVKTGLIEVEYGQIYRAARDWREEQDYSIAARHLDEATTGELVHNAERFVARLERYLRDAGGLE